jgi:hypothetical protein
MKSTLGHIGINLSSEDEPFSSWKDLLTYLDFEIIPDGNHFDATDGHADLCVQVTKPDYRERGFHRKRTGLGHIAFQVDSADMVDVFVNDFLKPRVNVMPLPRSDHGTTCPGRPTERSARRPPIASRA